MRRPSSSPSARRLVLVTGRAAAVGRVALVGAGPGDPELLTVKAAKAIAAADVIVHDGLVSEAILALAPAATRRIGVAKRKSRHSYTQAEIDRLIVGLALQGLYVVRLKGGDPLLFARGGEEMLACRDAGVPCAVIPGVTAAVAASAAAQAPLTHRGLAQAVTFVTAHDADGALPELDYEALARLGHTLVVYMGRTRAAQISARLIEAGRSGATPALVVENASLANERRRPCTLATLAEAAEGLDGPAVLIVGEAMSLAEILLPPLHGEGRDGEAVRGGASDPSVASRGGRA
jgi:uroporphyrin-III C-methyltransferase